MRARSARRSGPDAASVRGLARPASSTRGSSRRRARRAAAGTASSSTCTRACGRGPRATSRPSCRGSGAGPTSRTSCGSRGWAISSCSCRPEATLRSASRWSASRWLTWRDDDRDRSGLYHEGIHRDGGVDRELARPDRARLRSVRENRPDQAKEHSENHGGLGTWHSGDPDTSCATHF